MTTEQNTSATPVSCQIGTNQVPTESQRSSDLDRIDYIDRFALALPLQTTAEMFARAMFGDTPGPAARFIWQGLLQLRLAASPDTIAGWPVTEKTDQRVRLTTGSWALSANLIIEAGNGELSLITAMRYDRRPARWIWTPLSAVHRRLSPGLLRAAAQKVGGRAPSSLS